ncbi:MAG: hypothetical protein JW388_0969 [Nitrospira sp.]|nr:hypothetical protein [Nitrospira sp.]
MLTNKYNLPEPMYRALCNDSYKPKGDITVTSLIGPVRIRQLRKRHRDEIVEDCSSRVFSLLGQAVHSVLERATGDQTLTEERLGIKLNGWELTGQTDVYEHNVNGIDGVLSDYKITSAYAFLLGEKDEWTAQLNLNAMLYRHAGFPVGRVQIVAILRDWSKGKAMSPDYPQNQILVKPIPLWPQGKCIDFASLRILEHKAAEELEDDELPVCTPAERWYSGEKWAVKKVENKKADRLFDVEAEARHYLGVKQAEENTKKKPRQLEVVHRPGVNRRCVDFCDVREFCSFYKNIVATSMPETEDGEELS